MFRSHIPRLLHHAGADRARRHRRLPAPDLLRFGFTPLYLRYQDVWDAAYTLADVVHSGCWADPRYSVRAAVT